MKDKTLFSVAMWVHRRPERLRKALESILIQDYDNVKIFCSIDDLKNDMPSLKVLTEYEDKGLDITCFSTKPLGFPGCNILVNELIKLTPDESWVHILDDDDKYSIPDFFKKVEKIIIENSPELIIGKYLLKGKATRAVPDQKRWKQKPAKGHISGASYLMKKELALKSIWPPQRAGDYSALMEVYDTINPSKIYWFDEIIVENITTPSVGKADI